MHSQRLNFGFYDEVAITKDSQQSILLSAPWLTIRCDLVGEFPEAELPPSIIPILAEASIRFPLSWAATASDCKKGFTPSACQEDRHRARERVAAILSNSSMIEEYDWWNDDQILDQSYTEIGFSPIAAFTWIRRLVFKASSQNAKGLSSVLGSERLPFILKALHQSYHVTSHCVNSLAPGLSNNRYPAFVEALRMYIAAEDGHHFLIERALSELGETPTITAVHWSVSDSMHLLRWCAENSPFALANCIGLFEMASYAETDPIAEALNLLAQPKAAKPLWAHFRINKQEEHCCIGLDLASRLPMISLEDVLTASIAAQTLSALFAETSRFYYQ
jgi:hypothetical protein